MSELPWLRAAQAPGCLCRYHLVVIVLIYLLPLTVMFVTYSIIGLTLWRRAVPRHQAHGANLRHLQAKKVGAGGGARASWGRGQRAWRCQVAGQRPVTCPVPSLGPRA